MSTIHSVKQWKGVDVFFDFWSHHFFLEVREATSLDKEDLEAIKEWCNQRQDVFRLLSCYHHNGRRWGSFFSDEEDLELVISSDVADEQEKQDAITELRYRHQGIRPAQKRERPDNGPTSGVVYLIEAKGQGLYKIGKTISIDRRMKYFATKMPHEPVLICTIHSDDIDALECELHEHFSEKNKRGEWFKLNEADLEYIKGLGAIA